MMNAIIDTAALSLILVWSLLTAGSTQSQNPADFPADKPVTVEKAKSVEQDKIIDSLLIRLDSVAIKGQKSLEVKEQTQEMLDDTKFRLRRIEFKMSTPSNTIAPRPIVSPKRYEQF